MPNRYIEFIKKYAKDKNIPYHCAICEVKQKGLYVPLSADDKKKGSLRDKTFIKLSKLKAKLKKMQRDVIDAKNSEKEKENITTENKFETLKERFNKKLEEYRKLLDLFNKLDAEKDAQNAEPQAEPKAETNNEVKAEELILKYKKFNEKRKKEKALRYAKAQKQGEKMIKQGMTEEEVQTAMKPFYDNEEEILKRDMKVYQKHMDDLKAVRAK